YISKWGYIFRTYFTHVPFSTFYIFIKLYVITLVINEKSVSLYSSPTKSHDTYHIIENMI
ncbi:hypothetical protein KSS87_001805, partial [Heliosperma pusillum]